MSSTLPTESGSIRAKPGSSNSAKIERGNDDPGSTPKREIVARLRPVRHPSGSSASMTIEQCPRSLVGDARVQKWFACGQAVL